MDFARYDTILVYIRYHTLKDQDFNTNWLVDLNSNELEEIIYTLKASGYITVKKLSDNSFRCRLTPEGMKFCQNGGFSKVEKEKKKLLIRRIVWLITALASLATIASFISQLL
ncbi:MAG: hypothetical protein KH091_13685 [Parabacteroides merdae]|jgi:hypothetical protein|nr:hypothetical protein [Parabacteroides merdae]UWD66723.1 MAG: hypothetical protein [Bacteriophage sp.]